MGGAFPDQQMKYDHREKDEIFSLGITALCAATNDPVPDFYDFKKMVVNWEKVGDKVKFMQRDLRYSPALVNMITSMLQEDPAKRPTFRNILQITGKPSTIISNPNQLAGGNFAQSQNFPQGPGPQGGQVRPGPQGPGPQGPGPQVDQGRRAPMPQGPGPQGPGPQGNQFRPGPQGPVPQAGQVRPGPQGPIPQGPVQQAGQVRPGPQGPAPAQQPQGGQWGPQQGAQAIGNYANTIPANRQAAPTGYPQQNSTSNSQFYPYDSKNQYQTGSTAFNQPTAGNQAYYDQGNWVRN